MVKTNYEEFAASLEDAMAENRDQMTLIVRKVGFTAMDRLVMRTPVKDGGARANWQATIEKPNEGFTDETNKQGRKTVRRGETIIKAATKKTPFLKFWITNNIPYIERLEAGHSKQTAPGGIMDRTFQDLKAMFS